MSQAKASNNLSFQSYSLSDTERVGGLIAAELLMPACVYLEGNLGAGKTTLCKAIIQGLGYQGAVTSPTYNLIQEYPLKNGTVYHMDLYRLTNPEELEFLAISDLWSQKSLFLIEWPTKGQPLLQKATHKILIENDSTSEFTKKIKLMTY